MRVRVRAAALAAALALLACGGRPPSDYAKPGGQVRIASSRSVLDGDLISYRTLTRDDFRASEPPAHLAAVRARIGAATCGVIASPTRVSYSRLPDDEYEASLADLRFGARMDRSCSWWNAAFDQTEAYVLEHEQIHFALFELEARKLDAEAALIERRTTRRGRTQAEAAAATGAALQAEVEVAYGRVMARSTAFDRDTSLGQRPELQRDWAERVTRELGESE